MGSKEPETKKEELDTTRENSVSPVIEEKVDDIKAEESPDESSQRNESLQHRFPLLPPMHHHQYPSSHKNSSENENPLILPRGPPGLPPFLHPAFIKMNPAVSAAAAVAASGGLPTSVYESIFRQAQR